MVEEADSVFFTPAGPNPGDFRLWVTEEHWRALCPELTLSTTLPPNARSNGLGADAMSRARARMRLEGYFGEHDPELERLAPRLADAVSRLVRAGIPAPFLFVYDEAWTAFHRMSGLLADLLGPDYRVLPDFWAWHVDPAAEQAGWRPHRDKGGKALRADGTPISLTIWIPLSDSNPLNGCMYMLPANRDPAYNTPEEDKWQIDLPSVRALPGAPGDFFCWNQAVLHWGARSSRFGEKPRISMAMEFQRADEAPFNQPLIAPLTALPFAARIRLIAKQIVQYQHMYPLSPEVAAFARAVLGAS
ncbi:phytanoyl-CoA dioxygenase family protein [Phenylobacterium sp.]|jgi:ectoine hydroxylase-related dioxygenase (phytanoyl-CoA dioxygenase family)|uniref:phytanoyl-CoA dioxygenase family protein n=1 Tax=Phenylobacterium sp. TaxID=1871053 RepID=UPI002F9336CB